MYMTDKVIPVADAVRIINEGGWTAASGHCLEELGGSKAIWLYVRAKISPTGSVLITAGGVTIDLPSDKIVRLDAWRIEIVRTHMVPQQRKKVDGGGWHDVPKDGPALRLTNRAIELAHTAESERAAAEDLRLRQEANAARRSEGKRLLLADLNAFVGQTVTGFRLEESEDGDPQLIVEFGEYNSLSVAFDMNGCEGGSCEATARVQGTSLRFEPERIRS